jgi:peptidoglycan/LPS O-acetylase OafA/YrhL
MTIHAEPVVAPSGPIPSLDGLRAIAVLLVFLAHSGLEHVVPGGFGVTVFFVMSGFLITTLLRLEYQGSRRIDFRGFYLRRFLRLMPPLLLVTLLAWALSSAGLIDGYFSWAGMMSAWFYVGNYFLIAHDFHGMPGGLGVVWSLAIEEHYYLLFPPLALLLLRKGRIGLSVGLLCALCVVVLAWRCWLAAHGASVDYLTMATDTRVDAILVGSLMALARNPWLDRPSAVAGLPDWGLAVLCVATLMLSVGYRDELFRVTWRFTLQSLAIAGLIHLAVARARSPAVAWLGSPVLVYLGTISYTVYLVHHMILLGLVKQWPMLGWFWTTLAGALLTLMVAEPMRRWVELPCARLRKRLHRRLPATAAPQGPLAAACQ